MEYLEPSFHQFHDQVSQEISPYTDPRGQNLHSYAVPQQSSAMITVPIPTMKTNETKPRLGKDEVEILERAFKKNPKPTTQIKHQFAEDMGVELARINNWFQNRRAKRKQEKKQEAYEAGQVQEALAYSEPSSPDYFNGSGYFSDGNLLPIQHASTFPLMSGPSQAVAPYNPQYPDPSSASMESLHRTMAAAHAAAAAAAASQHQDFGGHFSDQDPMTNFGGSLVHASINYDRAQFPITDGLDHFEGNHGFSCDPTYPGVLYGASNQPIAEPQPSPMAQQTPTPFQNYSAPSAGNVNGGHVMASFPSQLLASQAHNVLPCQRQDSDAIQSPEDGNGSAMPIDFKYVIAESDNSSNSPPAPMLPFKSPPPPTDLASRRKKVHVKPAALTADTLRSRPSLGPRTVSNTEGLRRPSDSPVSSPMRRIVSAGGNRSIVSGRVNKTGIESAQRSPININGFADARAFMEHNYHTIQCPPSLTAGSSLNSSLAPPTPMSPPEREMTLGKREGARSTVSPVENCMNFVFNAGVPGCFTTLEEDHNLASPPETPQAQMALHPLTNGWPTAVDLQEKQWHFDVPDEPLYTPSQDGFPIELQMPQPSYLSSLSQPVTPGFGQFNPNSMFGHESPQYNHESPQYTFPAQGHSEFSFPDPIYSGGMMSTSPMTRQKTFQFSNTTAADFSEK